MKASVTTQAMTHSRKSTIARDPRNAAQERLIVDPEFRKLIPEPQPDELAQLEINVVKEGCRDALVAWRENSKLILLDGYHRHEICKKHELPFKIQTVDLPSREHARLWIEQNQVGRRNLNDDQRAELALSIKERRTALAIKEQRRQAGRASGAARRGELNESAPGVRPVQTKPKRDTRADTAREFKVSEKKMRKIAYVGKIDPEARLKIRRGELRLNTAMHNVRQIEIKDKLESVEAVRAKELAGLYDVIVADPPWPEPGAGVDGLPVSYPVMSVERIQREVDRILAKHAEKDCHFFLWTTQRFLYQAFRLLDVCGFKYVCTFIWKKPGGPQPIGLPQYNAEFVLYARRGAPKFIDTKDFRTCFEAPRGAHSEKPSEFYAMIARVTAGRRVDLFARREIPGFDNWGKEAPRTKKAS